MQAKSPRPFGKAPFVAISSLLVLDVSNDTPSSSRLELTTNEIFQMDHLLFHRALDACLRSPTKAFGDDIDSVIPAKAGI